MSGLLFALHVVSAFVGAALAICVAAILHDRVTRPRRATRLQVDLAQMNRRRARHERMAIPVVRAAETQETVRIASAPGVHEDPCAERFNVSEKTGISWTDATWNPTRGCSRVSEVCRHCYAEVQAARIVRMGKGKPTAYDGLVSVRSQVSGLRYTSVEAAGSYDKARWTGKVAFDAAKLAAPLGWRKPRRVFVNSMSDLFHESLTNEQIAAVFGVMAACPQHTFQVLTKRAKRMREWFAWIRDYDVRACATEAVMQLGGPHDCKWDRQICAEWKWPLSNVWLGVSVENQAAADERIPDLLATPAAVRFLSCEPLLGKISLNRHIRCPDCAYSDHDARVQMDHRLCAGKIPGRLDWVIAGCESGPGARPAEIHWYRSLRDQCAAADVPFFLKQAVAEVSDADPSMFDIGCAEGSKRKPGGIIELPYLDGVQHAAFPEVTK